MRRAAPFLAAALIGAFAVAGPALGSPAVAGEAASARYSAGSTSAGRMAASRAGAGPAAAIPVATAPAADTPAPASAASASPILAQIPGNQWQVTVQVFNTGGTCPAGHSHGRDYLLETTSPARVLAASRVAEVAAPVIPILPEMQPVILKLVRGALPPPKVTAIPGVPSCEVRLTFHGPQRIPATATLVIDGASTLSLTIIRDLSVRDYLDVPLEFGGILAAGLLILAMFIRVYRPDGKRRAVFWKPHRKERSLFGDFWKHQLTAASAWSLNDSWATNIAASAAVLTTILGLTTADTLFRGLLLDRFSILMAVAGAIAAAAPLLFGLLYAFWIARNPGLTDSAVVLPPSCLKATLSNPPPAGHEAGQQAQHEETVLLTRPGEIRITGRAAAVLPRGTAVTLPDKTLVRFGSWPFPRKRLPATLSHAVLDADVSASLTGTEVTPPVDQPGNVSPDPIPVDRLRTEAVLPAGAMVTLLRGAMLTLPDGRKAELADQAGEVMLPAGARAVLAGSNPAIRLADQETVALSQPAAHPGTPIPGPARTALLSRLSRLGYQVCDAPMSGAQIKIRAGGKVTAPWGATAAGSGGPTAAIKPGAAILVPPGTTC